MIHEEKPNLDDTLAHFGVKGMKWGERKKRSSAPRDPRTMSRGHQIAVYGLAGAVGKAAPSKFAAKARVDLNAAKSVIAPELNSAKKSYKQLGRDTAKYGMAGTAKRRAKAGINNVKKNLDAQKKFDSEKLGKLTDAAKSGDYKLDVTSKYGFSTKTQTGEQFLARVAKGGKFNVKLTDISEGRVAPHPNDKGPVFVPLRDGEKIGQYKWKNYNKKK